MQIADIMFGIMGESDKIVTGKSPECHLPGILYDTGVFPATHCNYD